MSERRFFAVQQTGREADIYIFGDITPYRWAEGDVSAMSLASQIEGLDVDQINVRIDSYGGSVSEGWAIYNVLRKHPAKIVTYADGFVASAALYPFMAGDERMASSLSAFYFHEVMTGASGYARDLRAAADMAELMTGIGMGAFTERAGLTEDEVRQMMADETWLTPAQALEKGIATGILAEKSTGAVQGAKKSIIQRAMQSAPPPPPTPQRNPILKMFENF